MEPLTVTRTHGQYTLLARPYQAEYAAKYATEIAKIEAEKPNVRREPRQKGMAINGVWIGGQVPMPKRTPKYIGTRHFQGLWWDRLTNAQTGWSPLVTETLRGEPWWQAEKRMTEVAYAIGWNTRDGLVPGDYIPHDMAEVRALQRSGLRQAS